MRLESLECLKSCRCESVANRHSLSKRDVMREFGAVGECKLDGCTCVTEGKTVMGYFAAVPGGAASPLPAIRRHTGNEDVAPPVWLNAVRSTLQMVWLNPAQST